MAKTVQKKKAAPGKQKPAGTGKKKAGNPAGVKAAQLIKKLKTSSDAEKVEAYMSTLKHPLKAEIEAVRTIISNADKGISERIKWNAPSYYYKDEDMVTFNAWATKNVHLVFHHPAIVKIKSDLLEGDYDKRRMTYFNNMKEVKANKKELERVIHELLRSIDGKW